MQGFDVSLLKNRDFRLLVLTRMCAITALQAQAIIVGWQVYSLTGSTWMLGLTGLAEAVPAIACAFYAGHIVDVSAPRKVYRLCLIGLFLNTLMLLLTAGGFIPLGTTSLLIFIFSGIFISGLARSFIMPSAFALLPRIVSREEISSAASWQTAAFQVAAIGGPTLAGLIYAFAGASGAWTFAALMSLAAWIAVVAATRMVGPASCVAAAVLPLGVWGSFRAARAAGWDGGPGESPMQWPLVGLGMALALLAIWKHRGNLRRLLEGKEPRIGQG